MPALLLALLLSMPALHSPHDVIEAAVISPDFARDRTLFVSVSRFNLLLRSTDAGESFVPVHAGLDTSFVLALAISPDFAVDRTLWCFEINGLYKSTDAGERWERLATPDALREISALAVLRGGPQHGTLLAGTRRHGLWASADGGTHWRRTALADGAPVLALDAAHGEQLLALTGAGLWVSGDAGDAFRQIALPEGLAAQHLTAAPGVLAGGPLWIATRNDGVWRGRALGADWAREGEELAGLDVLHVARADAADGTSTLYAASADRGLLVRRGADPWRANPDGLREPTHQTRRHALATLVSPDWAKDRTVFAVMYEGLHVSTSAGDGWRWLSVLPPTIVRNLALSPDFARDGTLCVASYGGGLLGSLDGGQTLAPLASGDWAFPDGLALSPDFTRDRTLIVGVPGGVLLSRDGGRSVQRSFAAGRGFPRILAFAPDWAVSGTAFAYVPGDPGATPNRFVRSADGGASWADTNLQIAWDVDFASDYARSGRVWATGPEGLFVSEDRGASFTRLASSPEVGLVYLSVARGAEGQPDILAAASRAGAVLLSRDGGASWRTALEGEGTPRAVYVELSPDFARDGLAFLGPSNDGVWLTRDGGESWERTQGGPRVVLALAISPTFADDRALLAGGFDGPWLSVDAGAHWRRLDLPLPESAPTSREPGELAPAPYPRVGPPFEAAPPTSTTPAADPTTAPVDAPSSSAPLPISTFVLFAVIGIALFSWLLRPRT